MTIANTNSILQSSVGYLIQEQAGAVARDDLSRSYDIDSDVGSTVVFGYGTPVVLGSNKGVQPAASTNVLADIKGFVKMQNAGIIDGSGYPNSIYSNLPILKRGAIYLPSSGSIDLDAKLGLCVDEAKAAWNKIVDITGGTPAGCIDVSTIMNPLQKAANSVCLVDLRIL